MFSALCRKVEIIEAPAELQNRGSGSILLLPVLLPSNSARSSSKQLYHSLTTANLGGPRREGGEWEDIALVGSGEAGSAPPGSLRSLVIELFFAANPNHEPFSLLTLIRSPNKRAKFSKLRACELYSLRRKLGPDS